MLKVLEVTLPLFGLVFCGFFGQRLRLLPDGGVDALNRFVFYSHYRPCFFEPSPSNP
jgi:predicted permease